jgi:hypothetical protein
MEKNVSVKRVSLSTSNINLRPKKFETKEYRLRNKEKNLTIGKATEICFDNPLKIRDKLIYRLMIK